ncbi:MAG TPA: HemK/PrmC family methyltransferase, partial [Acidimicrobiales bacterium]
MRDEEVVERLRAAGCVAAEAEADEMLAASPDPSALDRWVARREDGEPLAWIVGATTFCGRRIVVEPGVYVPRPQTEELARRAAALLPDGGRALDLCTGSGAVAAHLAASVPSAAVVATDLEERAVRCARRNGVTSLVADLAEPFRPIAALEVITAVAPYVPTDALRLLPADVQRHEPRLALDGGDDGLELVRRIVEAAGVLLTPGGHLLVEVGADHDAALSSTFTEHGFEPAAGWF